MPIEIKLHDSKSQIKAEVASNEPIDIDSGCSADKHRLEILIKQEIEHRIAADAFLQEEIDSIVAQGGRFLHISEKDDGSIDISLLNNEHQVLSTKTITLTKKLIKAATLDYRHSKVIYTCKDNSVIELDISDIVNAIVANTTAINNEIARATAREDQIEADLTNLIDIEEERATDAEAALQTAIDAEKDRAEATEAVLQADIDTEKRDRIAEDANLQTSITEEANTRVSEINRVSELINAEAATRENADSTLQANIDDEETRAKVVEANLQEQIDKAGGDVEDLRRDLDQEISARIADVEAEENRATVAEDALDTRVSDLEGRDYLYHSDIVDNTITADANNPLSANQGKILRDDLTNESQHRAEQDSVLTDRLDKEIQDRIADVDAEESRATGVESILRTDLNNHRNNTNNPHNVTAQQLGLGNVVNTGDSATPIENGTTKFTTGGAYTLKTTLEAADAAINTRIDSLDLATVGSNGGYIKTIGQVDGQVSATKQDFDTSVNSTSTDTNAPTSKAVWSAIDRLELGTTGGEGKYIRVIGQSDGQVSATEANFDNIIPENNPSNITAPTTKAVRDAINALDVADISNSANKTIKKITEQNGKIGAEFQYISIESDQVTDLDTTITNAINKLDVAEIGGAGKYIRAISETDGKILATQQAFDTTFNSPSNNNAPTTKIVDDRFDAIETAIDAMDLREVGADGSYIKLVSQENGEISATAETFDTSIPAPDSGTAPSQITAPTSKAIVDYIDAYGGKIDSISITGDSQTIDANKNVDLSVVRTDISNQNLSSAEKINAKTNLDLQNVDNTRDLDKPISTATQTALNLKADKVVNAINGNLAGLNTTGNLTDSGIAASNVVTLSDNQIIIGAKTFATDTTWVDTNSTKRVLIDTSSDSGTDSYSSINFYSGDDSSKATSFGWFDTFFGQSVDTPAFLTSWGDGLQYLHLIKLPEKDGTIALNETVPQNQMAASVVYNATTNISGKVLTNYTAIETSIGGYPAIQILHDGNPLTEELAIRYMAAQTGSNFLPKYDYDKPTYSYLVFSDGKLYKAQYDATNGLVLYYMNQLAYKSQIPTKDSDLTNDKYVPFTSATLIPAQQLAARTNIGLNNVVNTGDSATPVLGGTTKFTTGGAYTLQTTLQDNIDNVSDDLAQEISDRQTADAAIDNKLNVNVHIEGSEDEITYSGDTITKTSPYQNLKTGTTGTRSEVIQLANATTAGMMSFEDYNYLRQIGDRVDQLEGQTRRLLYTDSTNPTASDIADFVDDYLTSIGITPSAEEYAGIAVVVAGTYHIWHYYNDNNLWKDDGLDTVTQFTNSIAGIILGSTGDGKVFAENDGTGSVNGWDVLKTRVSNVETGMVSNVAYDTTNKKFTKTINNTTSDIVATAQIKTDLGLHVVATSGSYGDLINRPAITDTAGSEAISISVDNKSLNVVTRDTAQEITGVKTFSANIFAGEDITIDGTSTFNGDLVLAGSKINKNTSGYGLVMPVTTSYTANKTLATTDYVVANPVSTSATLSAVTINNTNYKIKGVDLVTTIGNESISDGTNTLNVATRDTAQSISGQKTFTSPIYLTNSSHYIKKGSSNEVEIGASGSTILTIGSTNTTIASNLLASANDSKDIGSSSVKWRDLYLSGGLRDGNNNTYKLVLPDSTSWTANKTIAVAEDLPQVYRYI